jgi:putative FmdB family regulatory protein
MPIYEYACRSCRTEFELLLRGQEVAECPQCGGRDLDKQFSVIAAPAVRKSSLPISDRSPGGCGLPQCGNGRCAGLG